MSGGCQVVRIRESSKGNQRITWRSDVYLGIHAGLESSKSLSSQVRTRIESFPHASTFIMIIILAAWLLQGTPFYLFPISALSSSQSSLSGTLCLSQWPSGLWRTVFGNSRFSLCLRWVRVARSFPSAPSTAASS